LLVNHRPAVSQKVRSAGHFNVTESLTIRRDDHRVEGGQFREEKANG